MHFTNMGSTTYKKNSPRKQAIFYFLLPFFLWRRRTLSRVSLRDRCCWVSSDKSLSNKATSHSASMIYYCWSLGLVHLKPHKKFYEGSSGAVPPLYCNASLIFLARGPAVFAYFFRLAFTEPCVCTNMHGFRI